MGVREAHPAFRAFRLSGSNVVYAYQEKFSHAITRATQHPDDAHLYWRLKALAYFLATQHNRTANGAIVDFDASKPPDRSARSECGVLPILPCRVPRAQARPAQELGGCSLENWAGLRLLKY